MTRVPVPGIAVAVSLLIGGALWCGWRGLTAADRDRERGPRTRRWQVRQRRVAFGCAVGFVVLLASRWPVLALVAGALAAMWPSLMDDTASDRERRRIEGIAKWLEDLRDTLRGSSVGAEEALEQVALRPPEAIADALAMFALRRHQGFRIEDALVDLADALDHPTADAAIAAIRLVVGGSAGPGRLHPTVSALAAAARDEVRARERVDRTRAIYRSSMQRLVIIAAVLVAYMRFAARDLLAPYGTPVGQMVLLVPILMWVGCIVWLRSLCRYAPSPRYRIRGVEATRAVGAQR